MVEFTESRRVQLIALLGLLNEGLPEQSGPRKVATAGFVNDPRPRTCPDCLANGRTMKGCETCGGSGTVAPHQVDAIAVPDELDTDGARTDPYAVNQVQPYGIGETSKLGHAPARDAEIDRVTEQLREPWKTPEDEIEDANRNPYPWERERASMRRRYDIGALLVALDELRASSEPGLAALVVSVYGRRPECRHAIPAGDLCRICGLVEAAGLIEFSTTLEAGVDRALRFLNDRMPDPIRAPGNHKHPALSRRDRRAA
jgi:hypothetical protein